MTNTIMTDTLLMVATTFIFVVLAIPFIKKLALHIDAVDLPNGRKIHKKPMPRIGGLGIYCGFLLGYMLFSEPSALMNSILISSFIIVLIGVIDDIKPLKASYKFIAQIVAACIIVFYGDILLTDIDAFGFYINFYWLSIPLTIFFILGCINCMNLIDGMDGLAGGISSIYFLTIGIICIIQQKFNLDYTLTFVMLGATLGFLVYNFNPASIFMGDSGSTFLGLIISVIALLGFKNVTMTSIIIPLLILAIPILDTLFAILRRWIKGEGLSTPDKFHIHHQFLSKNLTQKQTVLVIYFINALFAVASILYILQDKTVGYIVYGVLIVLVVLFVMKTNVVFESDKLKDKIKNKLSMNKDKNKNIKNKIKKIEKKPEQKTKETKKRNKK